MVTFQCLKGVRNPFPELEAMVVSLFMDRRTRRIATTWDWETGRWYLRHAQVLEFSDEFYRFGQCHSCAL